MPFRPLSRFLLRAPLLPAAAGAKGSRALLEHPLGAAALSLASPALTAAMVRGAGAPAVERYARRAAFRATPHGLLAGVAMGALGARTRVATGDPHASVTVAWGRLMHLGRALLDDPDVRAHVRLRSAPSLLRSGDGVSWLGWPVGDLAQEATAEVDARLAAVLDATRGWADFAAVRWAASRVAEGAQADAEADVDEYLMVLCDEGLLLHDLAPPLVGEAPLSWMERRLRAPGTGGPAAFAAASALLRRIRSALRDGRLDDARALLAEEPGGEDAEGGALHAVLVFAPPVTPTLSRHAVARAAAVAPVLFRLQEALTPPAAERELDPGLGEALDAITEVLGAGAFNLEALAGGEYGTPLSSGDIVGPHAASPPPALLTLLVDRLMEAAAGAAGSEARLSSAELDAVLPESAVPTTFELVLAPVAEPKGTTPGAGWLLGLHAPAGASWGRFAHALGAPASRALRDLTAAERAARPGEERLDVAFAPSPELADLCTHPATRRATLALSGWADGETVTPADLELCADAAALEPLALRAREGQPVTPSPLARVRSTTAPAGVYRLLSGWSLWRQHAPWALALGPLAELSYVPRVSVDGFVVSPASWRLPGDIARAGVLSRWRRGRRVPRYVQVGHEDELLLVDLTAPRAARELAGHSRVFEVYPPLGGEVDRSGRRLEAVVAVVEEADRDQAAHAAAAAMGTRAAGRVPAPRRQPGAAGWRTFKLFGALERQDRVLVATVAPTIASARVAGEIDRWFFLRYVDGPGRRDHLRVRVHEAGPGMFSRFAERLDEAAARACAAGDVVTVEIAAYHPELARYGGPTALPVVERIFESDSELVCDLVTAGLVADDPVELVVRSLDTLTTSLGLDGEARRALARRRREAHRDLVPDVDLAAEYRLRQRPLMAALVARPGDAASGALVAHAARLTIIRNDLHAAARDAVLPALLHMAAVRLAGSNRDVEVRAYTFWERALEGLARRGARGA